MHKARLWCAALVVGALFLTVFVRAGDDKPKYTIEQIMKAAHSGSKSLQKKLEKGTITDEEKGKLVEYYEELGKNKPPKGSAEDWQKRTTDVLTAAKAAVNGGAEEIAKYKKATNCKSCHDAHKSTED
jgi:hypothetical protein